MTLSKFFACTLIVAWGATASAQAVTGSGVADEVLDSLLAQQWVKTDADGTLQGHVAVPAGGGLRSVSLARVSLISMGIGEGASALRGKTTLEGSFAIENVQSGTYAMVVYGSDALASYVIHVLPATAGKNTSDQLQVLASRTSSDFVMQRVRSYIPLQPALPYAVRQFAADPIADRSPVGEGQVFASANGTVTGRIALPISSDGKVQPLQNMNVMVVQGSKSVTTATVGSDGRFSIAKLTPGDYGLIAAGESGFAAIGFEVAVPTTASRSPGTTRLVAFHAAAVGETELNVEIVPGFATDALERELNRDENGELIDIGEAVVLDEYGWPVDPNAVTMGPSNPAAGSAQAGSGSGGGGGGGGAGGLEGLGAIAAAAAALAVQNGDNVASPANP